MSPDSGDDTGHRAVYLSTIGNRKYTWRIRMGDQLEANFALNTPGRSFKISESHILHLIRR